MTREIRKLSGALCVVFVFLVFAVPMRPFAQPLYTDQAAISAVISAQIEALRRGDGAGAFSHAAPSIQARFQTSKVFMTMVQAGYSVLINPQSVEFLEMRAFGDRQVQAVAVIGADGSRAIALYEMEKQADGAWLISGCVIREDTRPQV